MMARGELDVNIFLSPRIPYWDLSGEKVIVEELGYSHSYINRLPVEFGKPPPKPNLGYLICPEEWKEYFFTETPRLIS
jgi:3'-phosphoadenosine 5'-phosphosulfate (PAPS) 3'-phosphatase